MSEEKVIIVSKDKGVFAIPEEVVLQYKLTDEEATTAINAKNGSDVEGQGQWTGTTLPRHEWAKQWLKDNPDADHIALW